MAFKKILGIGLAGVMALSMAACGSSAGTSSASTAAGTAQSDAGEASSGAGQTAKGDLLIGVTLPSISSDFTVAMRDGIVGRLEEAGCKVQFDSADNDVTKQANQVENDITMGCDALIVWPVNGDGISSTCKKAVEQGIPVLGFANKIKDATANNVAASDEDMGESVADMASDWIDQAFADAGDKEVDVLCITASNTPEAVDRSTGMQKLAEKNAKVKLSTAEVDWDSPDQSRKLVENSLLADPDIDVILTPGNTVGAAANSYIMSASSPIEDKSKFAVFTVDETEEIISAIRSSESNEAVLRGTVSMGSIDHTVDQLMKSVQPLLDGGTFVDIQGDAVKLNAEALKEK
jgi:ribose transport system substrate-binding protein